MTAISDNLWGRVYGLLGRGTVRGRHSLQDTRGRLHPRSQCRSELAGWIFRNSKCNPIPISKINTSTVNGTTYTSEIPAPWIGNSGIPTKWSVAQKGGLFIATAAVRSGGYMIVRRYTGLVVPCIWCGERIEGKLDVVGLSRPGLLEPPTERISLPTGCSIGPPPKELYVLELFAEPALAALSSPRASRQSVSLVDSSRNRDLGLVISEPLILGNIFIRWEVRSRCALLNI